MNSVPQHRDWILGTTNFGALTLAVLFPLLLMSARPAHAQTETVLHNFTGPDGAYPKSNLTSDGKGNFYGTTFEGGASNSGAVFELSPNGSGGWNETVLYSFTGGPGFANPSSYVIFDRAGNLYGTTQSGTANIYGVVFELSPVGESWTETVLYNFTNWDGGGATPYSGLIFDPAGNLYDTTKNGGSGGGGTVFELSPSGGGWTEQVIYNTDQIYAGLTMDTTGNIFGASNSTVFELSPNGTGGWNPTVLHTFTGGSEDGGVTLSTPVLDKAGNLYGTTYDGGAKNDGTVYKLSPGKTGTWTEQILYSFKGGKKDGSLPPKGIVFDAAGNIYGTTTSGGTFGDGTVYELVVPVGTGGYTEKVLWSFNGTDGATPGSSLLLDAAGNFYGTTGGGGSSYMGVVFEVNPSGKTTTTTLTSSPNPSTYGQAVTYTTVVTPMPPDGETISFMKGKTVLGTGTLSGGSASFITSALPVGKNAVTAV